MQRLFFALIFALFWAIGNANYLGALLVGGILGNIFARPTSPEANQAIALVLVASGLIIPAVLALLLLWLTRARRFLRSSSLAHRVLEIGILLSCIRLLMFGTFDHRVWKTHQAISSGLYVVSGYALPVLIIGIALVFFVGKRLFESTPLVEQKA